MPRALLEPVAAGQTRFRMQGLVPDARGIAVGREALCVFETLDRLVGFIGAYSDAASLDELLPSLTIERGRRSAGGSAIILRCAVSDSYEIDRLAKLAAMTRGRIYTGSGSVFVRARSLRVPFGYDLAVPITELGGASPHGVYAVDMEFASEFVELSGIDPVELIQGLPLTQVPLPLRGVGAELERFGLAKLALVLIAPGISTRVLQYLWHRRVTFRAVSIELERDAHAATLLRIEQPSGELVDILHRIPGVEIFRSVSERAAVEIGWEHPIRLAAADSCLPGSEMYLFRGRVGRVERLATAPRFIDGRHLVQAHEGARVVDVATASIAPLEQLEIQLELERTQQPSEARAALVRWKDMEVVRRLIYLVPPSALAAARVVPLREGLFIISGMRAHSGGGFAGGSGFELVAGSYIPVGARYGEVAPNVLIPDGYDVRPRVRPELIRQLLGLDDDDFAVYLDPQSTPVRVRSSQFVHLDAAVIGSMETTSFAPLDTVSTASAPASLSNRKLGRFALWGFRGGTPNP